MNNQAAQTMPLPCPPWRSIDELEPSDDLCWFIGQWDGKSWTVDGPRTPQSGGYDADEWDYFCYADAPPTIAALSQPAGVPDGMIMAQKHDLEWIVAHVLDECRGSGPCADLAARRVRALLAAAPAASGGEDGWSLAMRVREALDRASCPDHFMRIAVEIITGDAPQPTSGASVSERARNILADAWVSDTRDAKTAANIRTGPLTHTERIAVAAIEHALSSPRQEGDSTAASAQGLRELVQRWREESARQYEQHRRQTGYDVDFSHQARSDTLDTCADELEACCKGNGHA
jgi:hypothetical protein